MKRIWVAIVMVMMVGLVAGGCAKLDELAKPQSVEQAYESLKDRPNSFDAKIEASISHNFPSWSKEEQKEFVIRLFPLTDAGSTYVLMEQTKKYGLLPLVLEYAEKTNDTVLKECCQKWMDMGE